MKNGNLYSMDNRPISLSLNGVGTMLLYCGTDRQAERYLLEVPPGKLANTTEWEPQTPEPHKSHTKLLVFAGNKKPNQEVRPSIKDCCSLKTLCCLGRWDQLQLGTAVTARHRQEHSAMSINGKQQRFNRRRKINTQVHARYTRSLFVLNHNSLLEKTK